MLEIGQILQDKYRIDRLVGKGGMGQVFEGFHLLIHRRVAIKILLPEFAASEDGNARFASEVRAAASVNNPHILDVVDAGSLADGSRFMVSEFLDGEPLEARLERGTLTAKDTARIVLELLDGLAAAHRAGITHRDLKPDNIFLCRKGDRDDFVKIIDFGISKVDAGDGRSQSVTTTGVVIGTPQYLSPERARGERVVDRRSDLYAVGAVMYRCVAGRVPFEAEGMHALLFRIALQNAVPLTEIVPGLDPDFSALTDKAMAKDPGARFQSAEEMSHAIKAWLAGSPRVADVKAFGAERGHTIRLPSAVAGSAPAAPEPAVASESPARSNATADTTGLAALEARLAGQPRKRPPTGFLILVPVVVLAAVAFGLVLRPTNSPSVSASAEPTRTVAPSSSVRAPQLEAASGAPDSFASPPSSSEASVLDAGPAPSPGAGTLGPPNQTTPGQPSAPSANHSAPARKSANSRSRAVDPPRPATTISPPAPKPTATTHPRRDFGY